MKLRMIAGGLLVALIASQCHGYGREKKCFAVPTFPKKVESVIKSCQDEVKMNLIDDLLYAAINENPFDQSKHQHVLKEFEDHLFYDGSHATPSHHSAHPVHSIDHSHLHPVQYSEHSHHHSPHHTEHLPSHFAPSSSHIDYNHGSHHFHQHNDPSFLHHAPHIHHSDIHSPPTSVHVDPHFHHAQSFDLHHHHPHLSVIHQPALHGQPHYHEAVFHAPEEHYHKPPDTHQIYQQLPSTEIHKIVAADPTPLIVQQEAIEEETTEKPAMDPSKVVEAHESLKQILADNKPSESRDRQIATILQKLQSGNQEQMTDTSDLLYHRRISKRSLFDWFKPKKTEQQVKAEQYHPLVISQEDRWMAGCLMQCVFKKNNAVDSNGYPTLDGVTDLYTDGTSEQKLFMHVLRAADKCLKSAAKKHNIYKGKTPLKGEACEVAFDVFDCVSDSLTEYCS